MDDKRAAYHEAGHAAAFVLLGGRVKHVSIVPEHGNRGVTETSSVWVDWPPLERFYDIASMDQIDRGKAIEAARAETGHAPAPADAVSNAEKRGIAMFAGELAVTQLLGRKYDNMGASGDLDRINLLAALVSGSEEEARRLADEWEKKAAKLSKRSAFRKAVKALVPRILEKKTLDGDEVHDIVEPFLDEEDGE